MLVLSDSFLQLCFILPPTWEQICKVNATHALFSASAVLVSLKLASGYLEGKLPSVNNPSFAACTLISTNSSVVPERVH